MTNEAQATDALKPCPFCGSSDVYSERIDLSSSAIICNDCQARGPETCNINDEDVAAEDDKDMAPGENAARRLWNTRTVAPEGEPSGWLYDRRSANGVNWITCITLVDPSSVQFQTRNHRPVYTSDARPLPDSALVEAGNALLRFFPLEEGEDERQCRFGDALADFRAALITLQGSHGKQKVPDGDGETFFLGGQTHPSDVYALMLPNPEATAEQAAQTAMMNLERAFPDHVFTVEWRRRGA